MASPSVSLGDTVAGKYRLEREIGRGGMGAVYEALDTELERRVAIKFLLEEHSTDQGAVVRFLREAKASVKIRSEHVVQVYDAGRLPNGVPYIVMEYLIGNDLSQLLERDGPLDPAQIAAFALEACEALAQAHAAGIVHRDLKPANLFLASRADSSHCIKILDFGISKITTSSVLTRSQSLVGSPYYMSPEQLETPLDVDVRADLWALGVIMYELATHQRPFEGNTLPALCVSVLHATPVPIENVRQGLPLEFINAVSRCLTKDRKARFQTVAELADALAPLVPRSGALSSKRIHQVLQNATTVPERSQPDAAEHSERAGPGTWAQTNKDATLGPRSKNKKLLAVIASLLILGIGAALLLVQRSASEPTRLVAGPPEAEHLPPAAVSSDTPKVTTEVSPQVEQVLRDNEQVQADALPEPSASTAPTTGLANAAPGGRPAKAIRPQAKRKALAKPVEPLDPMLRRR
jgi:serine/threonine-protein kinase